MKKDPIDIINKMAAELGLGGRGRSKHDVNYWQVKGDFFSFAYTPWRQPDGKYYALRYRSNVLVKKVAFGRRKIAKKRAYEWFCKRRELLKWIAAKRAAKPKKPVPTKTEILQKKLERILGNIKKMETKKKRLETLLRKRRKTAGYYSRRIEKLKGAEKQ